MIIVVGFLKQETKDEKKAVCVINILTVVVKRISPYKPRSVQNIS